jgi:hypothetical protein
MTGDMTQPGAFEPALQRAPELPESMRIFSRIEDLVGQEHALLQVPDRERTREQRDRLQAIGLELDRVFERLRQRAAGAGT